MITKIKLTADVKLAGITIPAGTIIHFDTQTAELDSNSVIVNNLLPDDKKRLMLSLNTTNSCVEWIEG